MHSPTLVVAFACPRVPVAGAITDPLTAAPSAAAAPRAAASTTWSASPAGHALMQRSTRTRLGGRFGP
jgi:hypothetical protein